MIRDPSDGSVREVLARDIAAEQLPFQTQATLKSGPDTGLRQPTRTDAQLRLERSREWLKTYNERKAASHAGGGSDEGHPEGRRSSDDQRPAKS